MPARKTGDMWKLACPFEGAWCAVALHPNGMDVRLVEKPKSQHIFVALDHVRHYPLEIPEWGESETRSPEVQELEAQ